MIDPAEKKAAYRAMGKSVPESDIDRLAEAVRAQAARAQRELGGGAGFDDTDGLAEIDEIVAAPVYSARDLPVLLLYLGLGAFARIWTNLAVGYDFDGNVGLFAFAIAVVLLLHAIILTAAYAAWRGKWRLRNRNLAAMAALAGYLVTHVFTSI